MAVQQVGDRGGRWQDWVNLLLGLWLIAAPFVGVGVSNNLAAANSYVAGVVVAISAIAAITRPYVWEEWLNLVVGLWLIIAPFILQFSGQAGPMWNQIIVGLVIAVDAASAGVQLQGQHRHA
jgi:hypothetical protein